MKKILMMCALFLALPGTALAPCVPDTGQTGCYDQEKAITCPQPGNPFFGQDGNYAINSPSYTKLAVNGNDLPDGALSWAMVRDNVTGLIWEAKTDDGSIHDKDTNYTWADAQSLFIVALNNADFGGYNDWRLPTVKELNSLLNRGRSRPAADTDYFPNMRWGAYWSSTADVRDANNAWVAFFDYGVVEPREKGQSTERYALAVHGVQWGSSDDFNDNGDGTITDKDTGLMWQKERAPGSYTWEQALSYCEDLELAAYDDWRLPTAKELQSIVDYSTVYPAVDDTYFPETGSSIYWVSTSNAGSPSSVWYVSFADGTIAGIGKMNPFYTRAVRAGQCAPSNTSTTTSIVPDTTTSTSIPGTTTICPPSDVCGNDCCSDTQSCCENIICCDEGDVCCVDSCCYFPDQDCAIFLGCVSSRCPVPFIYGEDAEETRLLRNFRDRVLSQTPEGQAFTRIYYAWSPLIVSAMEEDEAFKEEMKKFIDSVLPVIERTME